MNPRKELEKIKPYKPPQSREGKIRMDLNESMKGCSPTVVKALRNIDYDHISQYPDYSTLRQKIAAYHQVHPDNILLTNGADEAIRCIIDAYLGKKDEILIPVPTFPMFDIIARTRGATVVTVLYNTDFSFPVKAVLTSLTGNTKMIAVVNPGSPTGTLLQRKDLIKILQKANDTVVLLDEAYADFAGVTNVDLIKTFTNLVVTCTFSKAFGLAGLRLGYAVSDCGNIETMYKVRLPFSVNALSVIAGCAALDDLPYVEKVVEETKREKEFLHNELKKIGVKSFMTHTNFLLVHGEKCNKMHEMLHKKGILVKNLEGAPLLTGWLRVTISTHEDNKAFLTALKEILPFQAILFDMDGVLVDEKESYTLAAKKTAEYFLGEDIEVKEILQYKAKGGFNNNWDIAEALIASRGKKVPKSIIVNRFQQYYRGKTFDGFIQNEKWLLDVTVLKELKKGFSLGIVTGRLREEAFYTLERLGVKGYFDVIITTDDVQKLKPDPDGIELALKTLQVDRAVYLGDTVDDAKAADAAGVFFVGVSSGNKDLEESFTKLGVKVVKTVNDIQKVLY